MRRPFFFSFFIMLWVVFMSTPSSAATLRYSANFDNKSIPKPSVGAITPYGMNWAVLSEGQYTYGHGRGGSGYSFGSGTVLQSWLHWSYGARWPTDEIYVSFWMRYPQYNREYTNDNLKFFYPHFGTSTRDKMEYVHYYDDALFWMHYNDGNALKWGYAYLRSDKGNIIDGGWHRYEFWWKFSTGESKFWFDRPENNWTDGSYLKVSQNHGAGVWDNYMHYLTFLSIDAESQNTKYTRFIDDIEVWDGIPSSQPEPEPEPEAIEPPENLRIETPSNP